MVDRIAVVIGINYTHFPPNLTKETATRALVYNPFCKSNAGG
jgi:hypothetical protein